ncbi:MAG: C69 family dipeptidase [Acidimicrobiia bacterium]|nr:C69 family dipeptidase [Acidimicrobiia bacterium]
MCDTMVTVSPGRVLFAKNSDRDPNEAQLLEWHPRRSHPSGATLRCTWIEIPQAPETWAVLLSRPFWMWGAEMGANEHGVVIGNEAVFTNQPYARIGLTGMDLLRLALERAATATEAVEVVTHLLERHGQGGGCGHEKRSFTYHNSFLAADPREAFVLETAGRLWEVERVTTGARSISNGLTIPGFAGAHSDFLKTRVSACRARQTLTQARAGSAAGPADLMAILRDHGPGGLTYRLLNGAMAAPCMHAGGVATGSQTTASWVAELTPTGARHWVTGTAAPCTGTFKPVSVTTPLDLGPAPSDRYDPATLWWRHERFHRRVMQDPAASFPTFIAERDGIEARWLASPPEPEAAFREADEALTRWEARLPVLQDRRPAFVRRYWAKRDRRAGLSL